MSVLSKHLADDVVPPRSRAPGRSLPPEADRIVLRAMAKAVADRYASAAEVQQDLGARARVAGRGAEIGGDGRVAPARRAGDGTRGGRSANAAARRRVGARAQWSRRRRRAPRRSRSPIPPSHPERSISAVASTSAEDSDLDRLRGSDVDDYEWTLRRQRLVRRLVFPLIGVLVVAAAAFVWFAVPGNAPPTGWSTSRTTRLGMRSCWCRGRCAARSGRR